MSPLYLEEHRYSEMYCYYWQIIVDFKTYQIIQLYRFKDIRYIEYLDRLLDEPQVTQLDLPGTQKPAYSFYVYAIDEKSAIARANEVMDEKFESRKHLVTGIDVQ